ncbi:flagellar motor switch protein FliN [Shewanella sp. NFH-SH190041]|uniref:flagellar motor switch protein FliN n=1 Tax=Shewanella sp. NFH-SH190041 TaxID=2950245 RepID=UPI0021FFE1C1|nr:flagellar motor switch protein FliN [Shewanella sp. NFH-SH190041]BDM62737.1 flagellar motor switch protein FliN [Shewanella sp. NFH-SH190041]
MAEQNLLNDEDFLLEDELFAEEQAPAARPARGMSFFNQLPVQVSLELASAEMSLGELTRLGQGDVITLDRMVGEPLDIRVNGALLGRGEVVEVNGRYGVRLLEVEAGGVAAMQE